MIVKYSISFKLKVYETLTNSPCFSPIFNCSLGEVLCNYLFSNVEYKKHGKKNARTSACVFFNLSPFSFVLF